MIHHGDLFDVLPTLAEASIDACVTDPPYDLTANKRGGSGAASVNLDTPYGRARIGTGNGAGGFMGMKWDGQGVAFRVETWRELLRVLKPGAHLVAFGGTRTFHRMTCAIEDAGFEIRDCLSWLYGSGFPKSLNLRGGLGTALKPAWEPVILARVPTIGKMSYNVGTFGTGALNIDACRIGTDSTRRPTGTAMYGKGSGWNDHNMQNIVGGSDAGRWPANVLLDEDAAAMLDEQSGELVSGPESDRGHRRNADAEAHRNTYGGFQGQTATGVLYGDRGGASRFYYVAKPSQEERNYGCDGLEPNGARPLGISQWEGQTNGSGERMGPSKPKRNHHPTVKPVELMRWLVRLVTPLNGTVLDPFTGSGTTGMACRYELRNFIGIEREAEYVEIAERRIAAVAPLFGEATA